ncbi:testicular acid phosphatase, partial [Caerostris extrusa]
MLHKHHEDRFKMLLTFLLSLPCLVCSLLNEDGKELVFVQILFRNGFSAPRELYPHDPNNPNRWEEGLGDLTLLGRRQMHNIGKELRQRYNDFITANPRE